MVLKCHSILESTLDNTVRRHLDDILADYERHMVPEKYQRMSTTCQWPFVDGYITWFYSVSHIVMTPDAFGHPSRPAHEEILENDHA